MNKRQQKIVGDYIRDIFNEVGLRDWYFYLIHDDAPQAGSLDNDANTPLADIARIDGRKVAYVRLHPDFLEKLPRADKRSTIVHEALHLHFTDVNGLTRSDLEDHLGAQAHDLFVKSIDRALEYGIDAIAEEWAKKLPPFPEV